MIAATPTHNMYIHAAWYTLGSNGEVRGQDDHLMRQKERELELVHLLYVFLFLTFWLFPRRWCQQQTLQSWWERACRTPDPQMSPSTANQITTITFLIKNWEHRHANSHLQFDTHFRSITLVCGHTHFIQYASALIYIALVENLIDCRGWHL